MLAKFAKAKFKFEENALFYLHEKVIDFQFYVLDSKYIPFSVVILKKLLSFQRAILNAGICYENFYEANYEYYYNCYECNEN
jgi:hypothetical protein